MTSEFNHDIFETLHKVNQLSGHVIVSFLDSLGLDRKKSNELERLKQDAFRNKSYIHIQDKVPSILQALPQEYNDGDTRYIRLWTQRVLQRMNLATFLRWLELDNIYNAAKFSFHHISYEKRFRGSAVQAAFVDLRTRLLANLVWDEEDQQSEGLKANLDQLMARHLPMDGLVFGLYPEDDQASMMTYVAARRDMMTTAPDLNALDAIVTTDDLKTTWRKVIRTTMPKIAESNMPLDFHPSESEDDNTGTNEQPQADDDDPMAENDDDSDINQEASSMETTNEQPQTEDGDPMAENDDDSDINQEAPSMETTNEQLQTDDGDPMAENDDDSDINQEALSMETTNEQPQADNEDAMTDSNYSTASDGDIDEHREMGMDNNDSDYQLDSDTDNSDFEINLAETTHNQHNNENDQPDEENGRHASPRGVTVAVQTNDPFRDCQSSNAIYDDYETESDTDTRRRAASSSVHRPTKKRQWREHQPGQPTPRIIGWDSDPEGEIYETRNDDATARNSTNNGTRPRRRLPVRFASEANGSQQHQNSQDTTFGTRHYRKRRKVGRYVRWTQDEVAALRQGLGECRDRNWGDILKNFKHRFAPGRTSVDLRDKARNEIKRLDTLGEDLGEFHYAT